MFVVQAPMIKAVKSRGGMLGWYFARVRFRRLLLPEAMHGYAPQPTSITSSSPLSLSLSLDGKSDYAITLAEIVAGPSEDGTLSFLLDTHELQIGLSASAVSLTFDSISVSYSASSDPRPICMDLRYLIQRDPPPDPKATTTSWLVSVSYRLRAYVEGSLKDDEGDPPPIGTWQTLQSWPETSLPKSCSATWSGAKPLHVAAPYPSPAIVSPFTEPIWAQFLPDSNKLIPQNVIDNPSGAGIAWVPNDSNTAGELMLQFLKEKNGTVSVDDWSLLGAGNIRGVRKAGAQLNILTDSQVAPSLVGAAVTINGCSCVAANGTWTIIGVKESSFTLDISISQNSYPEGGNWVTQFSYQLLVTEPIVDVAGRTGQERYLGLYAPNQTGAVAAGELANLADHRGCR